MMKPLVKKLMQWAFRVKVHGQYESHHKKTLIIANHSSFLDGLLLALFLPANPVFVVHSTVEKSRLFRYFLRYIDYLAVDPSHPMAMKKVIKLLDSGRPVAIFPEGRITTTGALMKVYSGAAFAASKSESTIIPVQITGAKYSFFSRLRGLFNRRLFPALSLTIFPATQLDRHENLPVRARREAVKESLHQLMMRMAVEARRPMTLFAMLLDARKNHGKHTMIYEDGISDSLTFNQLVHKAVGLSHLLSKQTLSPRVGVLLPNSNVHIITFFALQHLGKVPTMINHTAGIRAIKAGLTATQADTIITSKRFIDKAQLSELIAQLTEYQIIYLEDLAATVTPKTKLQIFAKRLIPALTMSPQSPNDEAAIIFTSGSEGLPKGVVHSHDSLLTNAAQIQAIYDFHPKDRFMICLPNFHVFGLSGGTLLPIVIGSRAFLYPNPLHYRAIPEIIYDRGCTILLSTSTFLSGYARFADQYDFHRLRYVIAGAEKLSQDVIKTYQEKFGIRVLEGYGTTETAPVIAANTLMAHKTGSVGKLLPSMGATLTPVEGIADAGRLIVSGDNVMLGYLKAEQPGVLDASPVIDGKRQYDTGDIANIDDQGFLTIRGRAKRFAKIAGEMVSLDTAEKIAANAAPDAAHAIITREDKAKGEALILFTTAENLTRKQLIASAQQLGISELAVPKTIQSLSEIPLLASGKTNYVQLKTLSEQPTPSDPLSNRSADTAETADSANPANPTADALINNTPIKTPIKTHVN
ncbi:AMP-binding protein [Ostreibacterium oceani]|uniref:AMP-binding protein n=1 Tax=Ostreibacterium oceani TaxID=2654998 RepID=A0A6N7F078_9GAMM|nr:AMP-binding protein [Ostreibacterium oceani]MPV85246.1 AMP-binding protein [Ostreibacterium oceani]